MLYCQGYSTWFSIGTGSIITSVKVSCDSSHVIQWWKLPRREFRQIGALTLKWLWLGSSSEHAYVTELRRTIVFHCWQTWSIKGVYDTTWPAAPVIGVSKLFCGGRSFFLGYGGIMPQDCGFELFFILMQWFVCEHGPFHLACNAIFFFHHLK